jgi:hypothetical protein
MMKKIHFLISVLLLSFALINAQTTKEEFMSDIRHAGGIFQQYIYVKTPVTQAPEGYKPFYISHYGRHGCRWLDSKENYNRPNKILSDAHSANKLTPLGESLYERVKIVAADAEGRYGDLSNRGVMEHRTIAERMFYSFPEVFSTKNGRKCYIYSRSTVVPRCILSMAANNERLKELNPEIEITREATQRNDYLNKGYMYPNKDSVNSVTRGFLKKHFDMQAFISSLFIDTVYANAKISSRTTFVFDIFSMASDLQDLDHLKISIFDIFSQEDIFTLWQVSNIQRYFHFTSENAQDSSKLLLKNILDCADSAIAKGNISADLRFGHDTYISPLLALMDIKGMNGKETEIEKIYQVWSDFKVTPMGVNLQIIFYRNDKTGDVLVKFLHNEKEVEIPIATKTAPYYPWKDVKSYYEKKLKE